MIERWLAGLFLALLLHGSAEAQLTPAEERGRAIYFGDAGSALDTAQARIGGMSVKLPAQSFPCASCHGRSGAGVAERGAVPADLSRGALTKPYTVTGAQGRKRPPYTLAAFRTAVRAGKDSGGNTLSDAMPRFELTDRDLSDVWAFLAVMDTLSEPGITGDGISIGVVLSGNPQSAPAQAQRKLLTALSQDINTHGGIHGRRLAFSFHASASVPEEDVFAILALDAAGHEAGEAVPVISSSGVTSLKRNRFSLVAGIEDQAAALRLFAVQQLGAVRVPDACSAPAGDARLLMSPACLDDALGARQLLIPQPVFSAIPLARRGDLPPETYVALPAPLSRVAPQAQASFAATRSRAGTHRDTILAEADAYSAASVLIESLMRSGRDLDRDGLVSALEGLSGYEGAITPPLSFGPNRHTGSRGAEIVRYSPDTGTIAARGVWIDPEMR